MCDISMVQDSYRLSTLREEVGLMLAAVQSATASFSA